MSIQHYHAPQPITVLGDSRRAQHVLPVLRRALDGVRVALVTAAMVSVPAAFWASITWLLWGGLAAAIVALIALAVTVFALGIVRSAREWESPAAVSSESAFQQAT